MRAQTEEQGKNRTGNIDKFYSIELVFFFANTIYNILISNSSTAKINQIAENNEHILRRYIPSHRTELCLLKLMQDKKQNRSGKIGINICQIFIEF